MDNLVAERELKNELTAVEQAVMEIDIRCQEDFEKAGELARTIKRMESKAKDYWEPMRIAAKEAYDAVLTHKKEMMEPMERAEKMLKTKMTDYTLEVERQRKAKEEEMRRLAMEEAKRKLAEAEKAEANGDKDAAEIALMEAEVIEDASKSLVINSEKPKTDGVSTMKTWEIVSVDSNAVPDYFGGVEIRPVDVKTVLRLIKASKGTIKIPGVVYKESVVMSVRK